MFLSDIENLITTYKKNYSSVKKKFLMFQNNFFINQYKFYDNDLDAANIILYFKRRLHKQIIRQREKYLDYNLSYENFWKNGFILNMKKFKIINISKATGLPKETVRRKVQNLIVSKKLQKEGKIIYWKPENKLENDLKKKDEHINSFIKLSANIGNYFDKKITLEDNRAELLKNYSFYAYHYYNVQIKYMKLWFEKFKDLELFFISQELSIQANARFAKIHTNFENYYMNKKQKTNGDERAISATTVSQITGIPRATCVRKLNYGVFNKIALKNKTSKKYTCNEGIENLEWRKEISLKEMELFCSFHLKVFRTLFRTV